MNIKSMVLQEIDRYANITYSDKQSHLYWIDWMKVIGMYFIIVGHIFPLGHQYIYVFSVPLFFFISGYLGHREDSVQVFWKKLFKNLILPCVIILIILHIERLLSQVRFGSFEWAYVPMHIKNCLFGDMALHTEAGGIGICWFIYTLALCKIIQQFVVKNTIVNIVVIIVGIIIAVFYNKNNLHLCNAFLNTTLAYPFYAIGGGYKCLNIDKINRKPWLMITGAIAGVIIVFVVGWYNGAPWMYDATYGKNIFLFFLGGLAGTFTMYVISYYLREIKPRSLMILSKGTIIILGFHQLFIRIYDNFPNYLHGVSLEYISALIILVLFIPIIQLSERYFPALLGLRANKHI